MPLDLVRNAGALLDRVLRDDPVRVPPWPGAGALHRPLRVGPSPTVATHKTVKSWERLGEHVQFPNMAEQKEQQRDFFTRLAEAGEDAIQRFGDVPGAHRFAQTLNLLRERMEEMQRKVRGIDVLEQRVEKIEQRLTALEKKTTTARRRTSSSASKPERKAAES
jgi:hypothetical protein